MAFSTITNQSDLSNLTVGSLLFPGKEKTISHPSSIAGSQCDGVRRTRRGPGVSNPVLVIRPAAA